MKPSTQPRWTRARGPKTLGVVMIVKDEADNLPDLLATIQDVADEVVVVDTGSRDGTRAVCKRWGVTLLSDPWRDDFARARNRSIQAATSRYLLWLDGDDRLPPETQRELARLRDEVLSTGEQRAYEFHVHNTDAAGTVRDSFMQTRLFPRRPDVRFQHAIHEEIHSSLTRAGIPRLATEMVVVHTGYASPEVVARKRERNEALLRRSLRTRGASVHHLVHLAHTLAASGKHAEADEALCLAIELAETAGEPFRLRAELHALRGTYRAAAGNRVAALRDQERAAELWPEWAIAHALVAEEYLIRREWNETAAALERARAGEFTPSELGLSATRAHSDLERTAARLCRHRGDEAGARACLHAALEVDPLNLAARMELGQSLLEAEDFAEAREVLEPAGQDPAAVSRFVDVAAAIALARAMTGDMAGAAACLSPMLDLFADQLGGEEDVGPAELAAAALQTGFPAASRNLFALFEKTLATAA